MREASTEVLQALAVTAEVCGADLSPAAAKIIAGDLAEHPAEAVLQALVRVRREHKGRLSLAAIIERIDDGRPGIEEAWALVPKDERDSAVLTTEMARALYAAQSLIGAGDLIAARMAFREAYKREVEQARGRGEPIQWQASMGWDASGRAGVLGEAVKLGRIPLAIAEQQVYGDSLREMLEAAGVSNHPALAAPKPEAVGRIAQFLPGKPKQVTQ
jgi:hypothetical protein